MSAAAVVGCETQHRNTRSCKTAPRAAASPPHCTLRCAHSTAGALLGYGPPWGGFGDPTTLSVFWGAAPELRDLPLPQLGAAVGAAMTRGWGGEGVMGTAPPWVRAGLCFGAALGAGMRGAPTAVTGNSTARYGRAASVTSSKNNGGGAGICAARGVGARGVRLVGSSGPLYEGQYPTQRSGRPRLWGAGGAAALGCAFSPFLRDFPHS